MLLSQSVSLVLLVRPSVSTVGQPAVDRVQVLCLQNSNKKMKNQIVNYVSSELALSIYDSFSRSALILECTLPTGNITIRAQETTSVSKRNSLA